MKVFSTALFLITFCSTALAGTFTLERDIAMQANYDQGTFADNYVDLKTGELVEIASMKHGLPANRCLFGLKSKNKELTAVPAGTVFEITKSEKLPGAIYGGSAVFVIETVLADNAKITGTIYCNNDYPWISTKRINKAFETIGHIEE